MNDKTISYNMNDIVNIFYIHFILLLGQNMLEMPW